MYSPAVARADARRSALTHVVRTFFGGSIEQAVAALVDGSRQRLDDDELARLADLIDKARKEGR